MPVAAWAGSAGLVIVIRSPKDGLPRNAMVLKAVRPGLSIVKVHKAEVLIAQGLWPSAQAGS
ncbi:hypothetical protein CHELA41_20495 [Hyphomicrobiales bacterium]|nr:hypothetical protein CHELA41_20495 [Hyphomicrobiales bacterium]